MSLQINPEQLTALNYNNEEEQEQEQFVLNSTDSLEKDAEILSLKKKLNEITEELNRAENAERMINDAKSELYEGHLQLREEYDELSDKMKHLELINDTSQTNIERLQTLLDDSNLRRLQEQQQYLSKEKLYVSKLNELRKEVLVLKQQNKSEKFNMYSNLMIQQQQRQLMKQQKENEIKNESIENENESKDSHKKGTDKKYKLLQDKHRKMSEILKCYKERDETNISIRRAWSKHMIALEKALLQRDAVTKRWREQSNAHEKYVQKQSMKYLNL